MKNGFGNWFSEFLSGSAILRGLDALGGWLYKKLGHGAYSFAFGSYDTMCKTFEDSAVGSGQKKKRGPFSRFLAENIEESVYVTTIASVMRYLSRLSMRVIGVFLMSVGLYSLLAQVILYLWTPSEKTALTGIISIGISLISIPFLFSNRALCAVVHDSAVFGRLARDFCGFRERSFQMDGAPTGRKNAAFILGLPFGILSCFINPALLIVLLLGLIFAYIVLLNPEFGYNLILFVLPFLVILPHPSILLALLTIYTLGCFAIKVILGKRTYRFDLLDALVLCFMAVMLLGGFVSYGGMQSLKQALIYVALMLGYFLTVGLVNTKAMLKKSAAILCVSLFFVAVYGLFQNFTGNISAEWIDTEMFDSIGGRVVSTFENPNMLGLYLILLMPLLAAAMIGETNWWRKPGYVLSFVAGAGCLIYTFSRGAWLGFLFAAVIFLLMWNKRMMGVLMAGVLALPMLIPYLPASIVSRFTSIGDLTDTSTNYRVYIWRGSTKMAADYALTGIGVGEAAFDRIYPYYSFAGIEKAPHAHNLFLQLFIEVGIFGFIVFLTLLICLFQNGFSLAKHGADKEIRLIGCGALCGVLAALVQGMTDYVWYNYRVFFVFWLMFGIVAAARRIDYYLREKQACTNSAYSVDMTI